MVESGSGAPICDDIYEDWVRAPVASHDLKARADALAYRYSRFHVPHLDENDVLRFAARSVVVSPMQAELLKLLLARFGEVVPREALRFRLGGKQTVSRNALDLHVMRLRQRVAPIGLTICTAWGRGYVLDIHKEGRA